jgi:predicted RecA/RadA family phage recombinase
MRNFIQPGRMITVAAPTGGVVSGDGVLIGQLFGVAATDAAVGSPVEIATEGVFSLPKEATTTSFAVGAAVEWDGANDRIATLDAGLKIGVVVEAAGATAATARVRLTA